MKMKRACYCFPYLNLWLLLTFIAAGTLYMQAQKWLPSDSLFAHYLQNKGYIHISGISQNAKALTRVYRPSITKTQHIASMVDQKTIYELASAMVKECDDTQALEDLRRTINEKLKG